jgi:nucleoside-diphosphate-sugar epimerase
VHEGLTPVPRSPYAASKLALEVYCGAFFRSYGTPAVALRYFNAYGPGQDPESEYAAVVPRFAVACLTGARPEVHGDGEQSRDFTYIDDVVEANLLAARSSERAWGKAFNVGGGGEPTSVNRLLSMIAERVGVEPDPVHTAARPGDIRRSMADVSLAKELLGFTPTVDIAEGIARTVDWFRERQPSS